MTTMLVREAMTTAVVAATPETTLHRAAALLAEHRITSMPVIDDQDQLVGVISEADVVRESLIPDQRAHLLLVPVQEGPDASYVGQVMTALPITVQPDADLAEAVTMMTNSMVKSLPVTEHGRVVGMISRADVVRALAERDERVEAQIDDLVRRETLDWIIDVTDGVVTFEGPETESARHVARVLADTVRGVTGVRFTVSTEGPEER
jgi:CBS domain-containing protein